MANWKHKIDIKESWKKAGDKEISIKKLAQEIAQKLRALGLHDEDQELLDIIEEFEDMPDDIDFNEFNYTMEILYDWGDTEVPPIGKWPPNKTCWIGNF